MNVLATLALNYQFTLTMREFTIDEAYLTDVIVRTETCRQINNKYDLVKAMKDPIVMSSTSNKDHDEFTKLREYLGENGYVRIERGWWNGDTVLKSFKLNGWTFRKGRRFCCAAALGTSIRCARKFRWKTLP